MNGKSDYLENKVLDHVLGATVFTAPATVYAALFTVMPNEAGAGGTEVSGTSYARVAITNNTTNFPNASGGSKSNGTAITFPTAGGAWGTVVGVGLYDASSGGNLLYLAELLTGTEWVCVSNEDVAATWTRQGHTLVNNDTVRLSRVPGQSIPGGFAEGTTYHVVGAAADTFQLSASSGGAAIGFSSGAGAAIVQETNFKVVGSGDTASFAAGALTFGED